MRLRCAGLSALAILTILVPATAGLASGTHPRERAPRDLLCDMMGPGSFIGVTDNNVASGTDSAILGGSTSIACDDYSGIGAGYLNEVKSGADLALDSFVAGGYDNKISGPKAFVGAGNGNVVSGSESAIVTGSLNSSSGFLSFIGTGEINNITNATAVMIGGGLENSILEPSTVTPDSASYSAIAGGAHNSIAAFVSHGAEYGFIGAGENNVVTGAAGVVTGGIRNAASGYLATVPGGYGNAARGQASFAAGYGSIAATDGSFVWSDFSPGAPHLDTIRANQFLVRASGGVSFFSAANQSAGVSLAPGSGTWSSLSDRNVKNHVTTVNGSAILAKLGALPISEWSYDTEGGVRHIGPMAQDFYAAFKVGEDDRHITTIDEDGVALASVKALHAENAELRGELESLKHEVALLARR